MLYKILSKSISITNYKIHFKKVFQLLCQLLWTSGPKYKIILTKVIEIHNTFRSQLVNQSTNFRLINKRIMFFNSAVYKLLQSSVAIVRIPFSSCFRIVQQSDPYRKIGCIIVSYNYIYLGLLC